MMIFWEKFVRVVIVSLGCHTGLESPYSALLVSSTPGHDCWLAHNHCLLPWKALWLLHQEGPEGGLREIKLSNWWAPSHPCLLVSYISE